MSDDPAEGNDPCACLFNHEFMMQRLLSILRQSQAYCTDNECLNVTSLPGPDRSTNPSDFMMLCMIVIVGLIMYALRPQSLRNSREGAKNRDDDPGFNGEPPMPPPAMN